MNRLRSSNSDSKVAANSIAIVGMSCRAPGAESIQEFWQNLVGGVESLTHFSDEELLATGVDPSWLDNPRYVKANAILKDITSFDADFFDVPPREAELLDPQQRLLLECSWEALENAGIDPQTYSGNIGIYAGTRNSEYLMFNQDPLDQVGFTTESPIVVTQRHWANDKDFLATRVAFKLNLRGPAITVQTACSTSLVAMHLATQSLLSGECDAALAGGVTIRVPQHAGYVYTEGMIFSPDGHTRSFDARANGTIFSSGAGVVALKRLEDALAERDHIYAVIRGIAVNNDGGGEKTRFSAPTVTGQSAVIAAAQKKVDIDPETISYVEAHGTATAAGDPIEVAGLTDAFRQKTDKKEYCAIGSVKSNIGHTVQAAGVLSVIKVALMLQHKALVPTLHFRAPNPRIDFANSPFYVNTEYRPWPGGETPRRAGVSSFGVGGTNSHVIMEEAPALPAAAHPAARDFILPLSARDENALRDLATAYLDFFEQNPDADLGDVCFTAANGRTHFEHRLAVLADSSAEMREKLRAFLEGEMPADTYCGQKEQDDRPAAFLFTGQGAQYGDMGRQLYKSEPLFRDMMDRCAALLEPYLDRPLLKVLYPPEGDEDQLIHQTAYTQPALFALEYSLAALWHSWGVRPTYVMGHSIGEYVAACSAGILSLEDGIKLIAERGRHMQNLPREGKMTVVFAGEVQVQETIAPFAADLSIAAVNGPSNIVISGRGVTVDKIVAKFEANGVQTRPLTTSHAFHSPLMEPMMDAFEQDVEGITQNAPRLTLISNVTGQPLDGTMAPPASYWRDHVRSAVRFADAVDYLAATGCTTFLEIGPSPTLLGMAHRCVPDLDGVWLPSLRKGHEDVRQMRQSLAQLYVRGAPIQWQAVFSAGSGRRIVLPTYPFQRKRFWIDRKRERGKTAVRANLSGNAAHPLLGHRLSSPLSDQQYMAVIDPETIPFLGEHRAFDVITFPATAYVEMVHAAAAALFGAGRPQIRIRDLVIHQALLFPGGNERTVQMVLSPADAGRAAFKIYSLSLEEPGIWTLHASGMASGEPQKENVPAVDLSAVQARLTEQLPIPDFYQRKRDKGMYHGLYFQGVRELWRTDGEALAQVRLPRIANAAQYDFRMHPALLDASIQIALSAVADVDEGDALYLPMVWEQISFLRPVPDELWSHAGIESDPGADEEMYVVDLDLVDADGKLVVQIEGLSFKRARREVLLQMHTANPKRDWLYHIAWERQLLADAEKSAGRSPDSWIIFADREGMGSALAGRLKALGNRTLLVAPFDSSTSDDNYAAAVSLQDRSDLDALIERYAAANSDARTGILYLGGIDTADFGPTDPGSVMQKQETVLGGLMRLVQVVSETYSNAGSSAKLWVLTQGAQPAGYQPGPYSIAQAPLWGLGKVIARELSELACTLIDIDPAAGADDLEDLLAELLNSSMERQIALRGDTRYVARLVPYYSVGETRPERLALPEPPIYRLISSEPGSFDGLKLASMERRPPIRGEVEIEIRATGVNFRDLLIALGRFDGVFGRECSGVVTALGDGVTNVTVGDEVMAIAPQSFASYVTVQSHYVVRKPQHLSFAESATVPMVFLTAYYGLHTLAKMKAGDRVLIHAASGGVGHAAIQLAQQCGAEIYATASRKKWAYLRSLGVTNIMDSRKLDFTDEIMQMTDGAGVDIVLNSLAGDFITRSLEALGENGRFIEIGATDVWDQDQIGAIRPDVEYHWFHLGQSVARKKPGFFQEMFRQVAAGFASGPYKPLPRTVFQIQEAVEAFRFMAQAKHIGKVVVVHRPQAAETFSDVARRIRGDGTYLVTGGLGDLGLKFAGWLADSGARHIVLLGRSAPSKTAEAVLSDLQNMGVDVLVAQADVADQSALQAAFDEVNDKMPPLHGIIHAAGLVDDGILQQQNWARFQKVLAPKVAGAWNLHLLTQHMPLDFFVLFSSISSLYGGAGQSNYAAGNAFMDTLAYYRKAYGLAATSINWGTWAEVGMAARGDEATKLRRAATGLGEIDPATGLTIFDQILQEDHTQIGVIPSDWPRYASQFPLEMQKTFLSRLVPDGQSSGPTAETKSTAEPKVLVQMQKADAPERREILVAYIKSVIARIGGLAKGRLEMHAALDEMGIDSLMAIELRNQITVDLQVNIPMNEFLRNPTLSNLTDLLLVKLSPAETSPKPQKVAKTEEDISLKQRTPLVPLAEGGTYLPLFLVHGIGGHIMFYSKLVRDLSDNQPCYGLQANGLDGYETRVESMEEMATQYNKSLTSFQPDGPYLIAGYSYGSYVAYEMACQLVESGREVAALISFDGNVTLLKLHSESMSWRDKVKFHSMNLRVKRRFHAGKIRSKSTADQIRYANDFLGRRFKKPQPHNLFDEDPVDDSQVSLILNQVMRRNKRLLLDYRPRPYPGKMIFFSAMASRHHHGWDHLVKGGIDQISVPGDHSTLLYEPNVSGLAKELQKLLDQINERNA